MNTPSLRQKRMAALAMAHPDSLASAVGLLPDLPAYTLPRPPEAGLILAQARAGNTGQGFHVGEVLVTRCTVCLEVDTAPHTAKSPVPSSSILGHAWIGGRAPRHAELAALCDALWQHPAFAPALDRILWPRLEKERQERNARLTAAVAPTRVDFFTLVRGEDNA